MDSRHFISLAVILLVASVILTNCSDLEPPLRVGCNPWPGYLALYYARDLHFFKEQDARLIDFDSTEDTIAAFRSGTIDAAAVTLDEALLLADKGQSLRIVLIFDTSNGADAVLARPPIETPAQLRGRRIAVETNALGAYMLARLLEFGKLQLDDVTIVHVPLQEQMQAYRDGKVDAVITFEPLRSQLLADGAREVFSSRDIPGEIVDVLAIRERALEQKGPQIQRLLQGYFAGLHRLQQDPTAAAEQLRQRTGTSGRVLLHAWQNMTLADRANNLQLLGNSAGGLDPVLQRLQKVMLDNKLLSGPVETKHLLDNRLLQESTR